MKKLLVVAVLALLAVAAPARANFPPYKVEAGANAYFRVTGPYGNSMTQLGPWYQYWPLESHFQTPALPQYPNWPSPMGLPGGYGMAPPAPAYGAPPAQPNAQLPTQLPTQPTPVKPANPVKPMYYYPTYYPQQAIQPVGYYPASNNSATPAYWYGR